ncbi:AAA family ATPase [Sphingobacterium sp. 2149]|uniref:McrB family protein n=1 Tax=Sphingobacterium sp. 2149 TaxID=2817763 RepID=UPI002866D23C|nr:AAA family ATPase [Sphingobacterium sp. 2149]MDR6733474.1 hypothetical protein [Sphingobacterium sp. 2149]
MLKDLNKLALDAKAKRDLYKNEELELSEDFKKEFRRKLPNSRLIFFRHTCVDYTSQGLSIVIPNQWFIIASIFTDYLRALVEYKNIVNDFGFTKDKITNFRNNRSIDDESLEIIKKGLDDNDSELIIKFLTDYDWWFGSKTVDRGDFFVSSILTLASVVHITQGHIAQLCVLLVENKDLIPLLETTVSAAVQPSKELENSTDATLQRFADWLVEQSSHNYFNKSLDKTIAGIKQYREKYIESFGSDLFDIDFDNLEDTIELIRENVYDKSSKFWDYSDNTSSHQPKAILGDKNYLRFLKEYNPVTNAGAEIVKGYNKIFFGAPGTGKSYSIAKKLQGVSEFQIERVIFHPDYDYSSFVGGYKPVTEKDEDGKDVVKYKFVPQVFTNIFEKAHRNPNKNFYLVIEEINRGNCAEIFGDIFQLLDRNPDYAITPSEELHKYLKERDENARNKVLKNGKMTMPGNLIILATMNTSDQSLFPMDSAFKRRWEWEYVRIKSPINEEDLSCPSFSYRVKLEDGKYFKWMDFVANVNKHILQNPSLGDDKCIGNFFVKPDKGNIISLHTLINKVIFYLWNDVFKDEENEIFADNTYQNYFPASEGKKRVRAMIDKFRTQEPKMLFYKFTDQGVEVIADTDLDK